MSLPLVIVVAIAQNGVIGRNNALPWRLKDDLRRFRAVTTGHPLIMGRSTFQSIGCPLPGRETVVLSRDPSFTPDGVWVASTWEQAIALANTLGQSMHADAIMVVGGSGVFEEALKTASKVYLTVVHHNIEGDTFFPALDLDGYDVLARSDYPADEANEYPYTFLELKKKEG